MAIVASIRERSFSAKNISDAPAAPGVYHLINNMHRVVYIGKVDKVYNIVGTISEIPVDAISVKEPRRRILCL